jgi:hypothetical protein
MLAISESIKRISSSILAVIVITLWQSLNGLDDIVLLRTLVSGGLRHHHAGRWDGRLLVKGLLLLITPPMGHWHRLTKLIQGKQMRVFLTEGHLRNYYCNIEI